MSDSGPKIKRDQHNKLDQDDADRALRELHQKLATEERAYQKEISFAKCKTDRRDIVVKIVIMQRNSVNGHVVIGDGPSNGFEKGDSHDPFSYKLFDYVDGEIMVREMPMKMATTGKWLMGCFKATVNYLARMGVMDRL